MARPTTELNDDGTELTTTIDKGNKQWVAQIAGTDTKYGYDRDFVSPYGQGSETVSVEDGDVIEVCWHSHGGREKGREYFVIAGGQICEIAEEHVERALTATVVTIDADSEADEENRETETAAETESAPVAVADGGREGPNEPKKPDTGTYEIEKSDGGKETTITLRATGGVPTRVSCESDDDDVRVSGDLSTKHGGTVLFNRPKTILGEKTQGVTLPSGVYDALEADIDAHDSYREALREYNQEMRQQHEERRKSDPLAFAVVEHHHKAGPDWPMTSLVLKPTTELSDEQAEIDEALNAANDTTDGHLSIPEGADLAEGDEISLDDLLALDGVAEPDIEALRGRKREEEIAATHAKARKEKAVWEKQRRFDRYEMGVERRYEEGRGETHAIKADVTLTDPETGETASVTLRNAVDIGWQAFGDGAAAEQLLDDGAREWLREFGPVSAGIRMTENEQGW